jgi:hypothetical protein
MADNTPRELALLVLNKITQLGDPEAAKYFEVSPGTIANWKNLRVLPSLAAAQKVWDEDLICQTPEIWGKSAETAVQILMPAYESIEPLFFLTMMRCLRQYGLEKINIIPKMRTLIVEARNDLAEKFLATKSEWCIFCDVDSVLPCGNGAMLRKVGLDLPEPKASRNAIERIMSHPADKLIVGALYKDRRGNNKAQCAGGFTSPQENARLLGFFDGKTQGDGLEEQGWIGFGLVRVHRSVFEMMKEESKPGGKCEEIRPPVGREGEPYGYFSTTREQRGEDVSYCRRAGRLGIKTYLDTGILLGHIGNKIF